jgi:hypothetical protein
MARAYRLFIASFKEGAASLAGLLMALSASPRSHAFIDFLADRSK